MAVRGALRRLVRLLEVEEEQEQRTLQAALGAVQQLRRIHEQAMEQERRGRRWMAAHAAGAETVDRIAGLEEMRRARRSVAELANRIEAAEEAARFRRASYLAKRTERRQADALLKQAEAREALVMARRDQQTMDDRFLAQGGGASRGQGEESMRDQEEAASAVKES